ncbi:uncharacterized protein LOC144372468 isoform X2 [Ictidomys tridecemlineatus]
MVQTPVTIPERLVYPPKLGQQYVVIRANWAATSDPSFMEKMMLVALHAGSIFIQTDKPVYTPEQMVQYRVSAMNHKMDPVNKNLHAGHQERGGSRHHQSASGGQEGALHKHLATAQVCQFEDRTIEASYLSGGKQKFQCSHPSRSSSRRTGLSSTSMTRLSVWTSRPSTYSGSR